MPRTRLGNGWCGRKEGKSVEKEPAEKRVNPLEKRQLEKGASPLEKKTVRKGMEYYVEMEALPGEEYEYEMCMRNSIQKLLPMTREQMDHKTTVSYEITGYTKLGDIFQKMWITTDQLRSVVENLIDVIKSVKAYLLYPDNLLVSVEEIYVESEEAASISRMDGRILEEEALRQETKSLELKFMYVPGYQKNLSEQIKDFLECVMERIDRQDVEAVMLAWHLHTMLKKPLFNMKDLERCLETPQKERETISNEAGREKNIWEGQKEKNAQNVKKEKDAWKKTIQKDTWNSPKRKKIETWLFFGLLEVMLLLGEGWILYQIYFFGILEWKRNIFLLVSGALVLNGALCFTLYRKGKEKERLEELFEEEDREEYGSITPQKERERKEITWENTTLLNEVRKKDFARLLSIDGKNADITITATPFLIGKSLKETDYRMKQSVISRIHARITVREGRYYIEDMASTNGTFHNGKRITKGRFFEMKAGDVIQLADMEFIFEIPCHEKQNFL